LQSKDALVIGVPNLPEHLSDEAPKIPLNPLAVKFVKNYIRRNNEDLVMVKRKSDPYFKIIESVFRKYGLPVELKYLAVIESDLDAHARSHVGAVGPWQLMPRTARDLGLKVTKKHDERTYYYKSTVAAAKYLRDLYAQLGDWLLVIAAYNGGTGTVQRAIHHSGSHNFWKLQNFLPAETRTHVKRFIGTHYYFEEAGSVTTLTKAEVADHIKAVNHFMVKQNLDAVDAKMNAYAGPDNYHQSTEKSLADVNTVELKKGREKR
jgi:membrane-bound lytic murein transglycosylase D